MTAIFHLFIDYTISTGQYSQKILLLKFPDKNMWKMSLAKTCDCRYKISLPYLKTKQSMMVLNVILKHKNIVKSKKQYSETDLAV